MKANVPVFDPLTFIKPRDFDHVSFIFEALALFAFKEKFRIILRALLQKEQNGLKNCLDLQYI